MIPDDESVRRAMQQISPAGADSPELFDRVAVGARRRRRQRSVAAVSAAAALVALVALVPALGHRGSVTKVNSLGVGGSAVSPSPVVTSSPGASSSTIASPLAVASSQLVVESPTPPLSSTPPTPPLITAGACAGLTVAMSVGDGQNLSAFDLEAEPSLNLFTAKAGWTISFQASGPVACANRLVVTETGGTFPTTAGNAQANYTFTPLVIRPDGPGVEDVEVMLRPCTVAANCEGGQALAEAAVSVDPPASSTASPVSPTLSTCPNVLPLVPGPDAAAEAKAATIAEVPKIYINEPTQGFTVTAAYAASTDGANGYGTIPYGMCGQTIGDRTWIVVVHFPNDPSGSASTGNGQLFLSKFNTGWKAWYRYH